MTDKENPGYTRTSETYKKKYKSNKGYGKSFAKKEIVYDEKKLYNYAINRLSTRDYGRKELFVRMNRFQTDTSIIDKVLDKLVEQGYLSDERRIRSMLNQYSSRESINKTKSRIVQKGFTKEQIEAVLEQQQEPVREKDDVHPEINKALELLVKKFKSYDKDNWDKMVRFLASKQFQYVQISKAIKLFSEQ